MSCACLKLLWIIKLLAEYVKYKIYNHVHEWNVAIFWNIESYSPYVNWCSSEMLVHIRTTWHYILEDGNIQKYCCENLKFYIYMNCICSSGSQATYFTRITVFWTNVLQTPTVQNTTLKVTAVTKICMYDCSLITEISENKESACCTLSHIFTRLVISV
jgi:hypothetical protein